MIHTFTESTFEEASLTWLEALSYVVLDGRLHQALFRLNPDLPHDALEDADPKVMRGDAPSLVERNRAVHRMLVDGVTVESRRKDSSTARHPLPVP